MVYAQLGEVTSNAVYRGPQLQVRNFHVTLCPNPSPVLAVTLTLTLFVDKIVWYPRRIMDTSPTGHYAYWTVRLLFGHFAYWTLRLVVISPTRHFAYGTPRLLRL